MPSATRIGSDPIAPMDAYRDQVNRALRPGPLAVIHQAITEVGQFGEAKRAELAKLNGETDSRKIRLANPTVRQRHEEHCRECEREVAQVENWLAELAREIPKREEIERRYEGLVATLNPVTKKLRWRYVREYPDLAGRTAALLLELREQAARIDEVRQLGRAIGKGDDLISLTAPVAAGTPELLPLWAHEFVRLTSLWNENLTFWSPVPGITAAALLEPPAKRPGWRNPVAVQKNAEREAHLDLAVPFTHHGTDADNDRQRERQAVALDLKQRRVVDPGTREDLPGVPVEER